MGGFLLGILLYSVFDGHRDSFVAVVFETPRSVIVTESHTLPFSLLTTC